MNLNSAYKLVLIKCIVVLGFSFLTQTVRGHILSNYQYFERCTDSWKYLLFPPIDFIKIKIIKKKKWNFKIYLKEKYIN